MSSATYKICNNCWLAMPWRDDGRKFVHKEYPYTCGEHNEIIVSPLRDAVKKLIEGQAKNVRVKSVI